jgi:simple sugar transport system substrate-binding protein
MVKFAPTAQMTSIIDEWAPYYVKRVQAVLDGTWTSTDTWAGIKDGEVVMAEYMNMADETKALAEETEAKIASGAFHPFTGPIFDQDGKERYAAGVVAPDGDLLGMNWYVKGIDDKLPQ